MAALRIPPVVPFALAFVAEILLAKHVPLATLEPPAIRYLGVVPMALGVGLAVSSIGLFAASRTTVEPFRVASKLVVQGPFRFSRNPIYLGMTLILLGVAFVHRKATPFAVLPLFVWWIETQVIRVEEAMLEETFGDEFRTYRKRVRRWVGWYR